MLLSGDIFLVDGKSERIDSTLEMLDFFIGDCTLPGGYWTHDLPLNLALTRGGLDLLELQQLQNIHVLELVVWRHNIKKHCVSKLGGKMWEFCENW